MKDQIIIKGGHRLEGEIGIDGAKNAILPIMAATLMSKEESTIKNVPNIKEVETMETILVSLGAVVTRDEKSMKIVPPEKINLERLDVELASKFRSLLNFLSVFSHHFKNFELPISGGCAIGKRTIVPHIFALECLGIHIKETPESHVVSVENELKGSRIIMSEASDTGTNIAVMAAVLAKGESIIRNAASNYMVQDCCNALVSMGAKIEGIGTDTIKIEGVNTLSGLKDYEVISDPINAFTYISMGIVNESSILVRNVPYEFIELDLFLLEKMGADIKVIREYDSSGKRYKYQDIMVKTSQLHALDDKIHTATSGYGHGVNMDNLPLFSNIAAKAEGETLLCDWGYEGRQDHFHELKKMGLQFEILDPHRVRIKGPQVYEAAEVVSPYLRAGMVLVIAALTARGETLIKNAFHVERGYPDIINKLHRLGAEIEKI